MERLPLPQQRPAAVWQPMMTRLGCQHGAARMHQHSQRSRGNSRDPRVLAGVAAAVAQPAPQRRQRNGSVRVSASRSRGHGTAASVVRRFTTLTTTRRALCAASVGESASPVPDRSGLSMWSVSECATGARVRLNRENRCGCNPEAEAVRARVPPAEVKVTDPRYEHRDQQRTCDLAG